MAEIQKGSKVIRKGGKKANEVGVVERVLHAGYNRDGFKDYYAPKYDRAIVCWPAKWRIGGGSMHSIVRLDRLVLKQEATA